ncbi:MAG: twin arginine-targeting protein translocase, TatA/E family [Chromatiaceae bacterium]|jgi:sec-independent protein translocase protein TatA|nr:twin arginine-targeting protein translocase, TatA/E family [Chromatiaceae bacterium]
MGISGVSFWEIMLIVVVLLLLFGSKKLPGIASDLGSAIRDFRRSMSSDQRPDELEEKGENPRHL